MKKAICNYPLVHSLSLFWSQVIFWNQTVIKHQTNILGLSSADKLPRWPLFFLWSRNNPEKPIQAFFYGNDVLCPSHSVIWYVDFALTNRKGLVHILQAGAAGVVILRERLDTDHVLGSWGEVIELDWVLIQYQHCVRGELLVIAVLLQARVNTWGSARNNRSRTSLGRRRFLSRGLSF